MEMVQLYWFVKDWERPCVETLKKFSSQHSGGMFKFQIDFAYLFPVSEMGDELFGE